MILTDIFGDLLLTKLGLNKIIIFEDCGKSVCVLLMESLIELFEAVQLGLEFALG